MRTNALLIRSAFGWTHETVAPGDNPVIEDFIDLGSAPSPEEVSREAQAILADFAVDAVQTSVGIVPSADADTPGIGYQEGSPVTVDGVEERVLAWSMTRNDEGEFSYGIQVGQRLADDGDRLEARLRSFTGGDFGGRSTLASPVNPDEAPQKALTPGSVELIFERFPDDLDSQSYPKPADRPGFITQVTIANPTSGTGDVEVWVDLTTVATIPLTGGSQVTSGLAVPVEMGQNISVVCATTGFYLQVAVQIT